MKSTNNVKTTPVNRNEWLELMQIIFLTKDSFTIARFSFNNEKGKQRIQAMMMTS
jgi:hypothetical protein